MLNLTASVGTAASKSEPAVFFDQTLTPSHPGTVLYEGRNSLTNYWYDRVLNRPLPLHFVGGTTLRSLVAAYLHTRPSAFPNPKVAPVVQAVDLLEDCGLVGLAYVSDDIAAVVLFMHHVYKEPKDGQLVLEVLRGWLDEGRVPPLVFSDNVQSLHTGGDLHILASSDVSSSWSRPALVRHCYTEGILGGLLVVGGDFVFFQRSRYVGVDLEKLSRALTALDTVPWTLTLEGLTAIGSSLCLGTVVSAFESTFAQR